MRYWWELGIHHPFIDIVHGVGIIVAGFVAAGQAADISDSLAVLFGFEVNLFVGKFLKHVTSWK
jgi:hypothetical protein